MQFVPFTLWGSLCSSLLEKDAFFFFSFTTTFLFLLPKWSHLPLSVSSWYSFLGRLGRRQGRLCFSCEEHPLLQSKAPQNSGFGESGFDLWRLSGFQVQLSSCLIEQWFTSAQLCGCLLQTLAILSPIPFYCALPRETKGIKKKGLSTLSRIAFLVPDFFHQYHLGSYLGDWNHFVWHPGKWH